MKSTPEQIRQRFDNDVERFSNLETGQSATIDAPLVLDLIAEAAAATTPGARALVDLSRPMLDRAGQRVGAAGAGAGKITLQLGDIRELPLADGAFDVILAAA